MAELKHADQRWKATVAYRSTELGEIEVEHFFEEIEDLADLVEAGPDWNAIARIEVVLNRTSTYSTLEEAAAQ